MATGTNKIRYRLHTLSWNRERRNGGKVQGNQRHRVTILLSALALASLMLFACAPERSYVRRPPGTKVIVLPETEKGRRPYVVNGERYYPLSKADGFVQYGKASWYGKKFHGRPTASGERFNMYKRSAAHKTLPMGTHVLVLNLSNKKSSVVRINDRGPFVKGRIIDLSYAAAKEIGIVGPGVVSVKIVALGKEVGKLQSERGPRPVVELADLERGEFTIQVGAFEDRENALTVADRLKVIFDYVHIAVYMDKDKKTIYKVQVSRSKTLTQAGKIEKKLEDMGFTEAFIVRI
jgi:rare lipoprotein A